MARVGKSPLRKTTTNTLKVCVDCGVPKSRKDDFYVKEVRARSVRRFSRCKTCYVKWVRRPQKSGKRRPRRLPSAQILLRHRARQVIANAVYRGTLIKPARCQRCGKRTPKEALEGHHFGGYRKPLMVKFVCRPCHLILG